MNWSDYFFIRQNHIGYYAAWKGSMRHVFEEEVYFKSHQNARAWITMRWRDAVNNEFEKEVLGGSERNIADDNTKD